jgi:hypothetical protein
MNQLDVIKTMAAIMGASSTTQEQKDLASFMLTKLLICVKRDVDLVAAQEAGIITS